MSESIGMMQGAYFVSRTELLKWVNSLLQLSYTKVEQCANGAAYCQIMQALYGGDVPMHKVNFNAKQQYEFINNYKVLQSVFNKHGIDRHIEVDKLIRGKYQDNLELLQWMKAFFDRHHDGTDFDGAAMRKASDKAFKPRGAKKAEDAAPSAAAPKKKAPTNENAQPTQQPAKASVAAKTFPTKKPVVDSAKVTELNEQVASLKLTVDGLEKERDFYFGKLRDIEIYCQTNEDDSSPALAAVQKILYATDDDFVAAEGEEAAPVSNEVVAAEQLVA